MRALGRGTFCFWTPLMFALARAGPWHSEDGWTLSPADEDLIVRPMFMLRHAPGSVARLHEFIEEASTPGRPGYGKYLTMADLKERLPVAEGAGEAVVTLLAEHGVGKSKISLSASGDMLQAEMSSATARDMFSAEFNLYEHPSSKRRIVRSAVGYTLPAHIKKHVYLVGNLVEFPEVRRLIQVEVPVENTNFGNDCGWWCGGRTTPGVLAARYGFNLSENLDFTSTDTGMATAEFQGVYYDTRSFDYFQQKCGLKEKVQVDHQIGTNVEWHCLTGDPCIEALLDIEYAKAVSGGIALTNIFNHDYSLLNWAMQVDNLGDGGPSVHSISYGNDEVQQGEVAPSGMSGKEFMEATNVQFAKLAARGVSVMVASGDQGVCGRSGCGRRFHPDFPASSPFVTAVGGTDFAVKSVIGEEEAWSSGGGGFSDEFDRPTWQRQAVEGYLAAASKAGNLPADSYFNRTGRAYPDVAALGGERNPFCIAAKIFPFIEKLQGVAGTSASCPVFAAIVARLNAARLARGMPRMGFMNPWIYQHPEVFHDVTKGINDNGGSHGFAALSGWDPTTGMGTPSFETMLHAALQPPKDVLVV
eukprot:TRINITY_DN5013_c0_g1_i1.p1 TRINITY_DN5013_c0_g1~~TRINITY_DN5013_c0_g1_i1.p1  ORF type:complete len:587 (+),score=108.18 TRINITY_DN5013_c0_g1_i1:71-1831(+)